MSGGGSFTSDQGLLQQVTTTGSVVHSGRLRVTSIQAAGTNATNNIVIFYDSLTSSAIQGGTATEVGRYVFGSEGIDVYLPGSGVLFKKGLGIVATNTASVTVSFTG